MTRRDNHLAAMHKLGKRIRFAKRKGEGVRHLRRAIRIHAALIEDAA